MTEPRIPEARDDDPEDVADKLSIASAMWGRGDRADALTWLRRAAESASDADADMRALELAKAASELAPHVSASVAPAPAPAPPPAPKASAAPPPKPSAAPPPKPSVAPKPATAAPPKPPVPSAKPKPPASRPPGGKLPPLPPLRPLGSAPAAPAKPAAPPMQQRMPSMITSATGAMSASGSIEREELPPVDEASKHMPWDEQQQGDDEPTRQIAIGSADATFDGEVTRTGEQVEPEPPPVETPSLREGPKTVETQELPLSVGLRVRLIVEGGRVIAEPDRGQAGTLAIVVPASGDDDLRTVFQR